MSRARAPLLLRRALLWGLALSTVLAPALVAHAGDVPKDDVRAPAPPRPLGLPWLGISMDSGSDAGVRVEHVVRSSPAEAAGVRAGDRIVALDGVRVTAPAQVSGGVATHKVGDTVTLSIERTGTAISAKVVLGTRPTTDALARMDLVGLDAPAFANVTPLGGAPSSIASLKGKVIILDFWASWCGPCKMIAPRLGALRDRLGAQGLAVVGVTTDAPEAAAVYAERHHLRYPSVSDKDGDTSRAYGIVALPTMVVVDKKGVVREVLVGFDGSSEGRLEAEVKRLLAEKS